jgi:hypothetical protein
MEEAALVGLVGGEIGLARFDECAEVELEREVKIFPLICHDISLFKGLVGS